MEHQIVLSSRVRLARNYEDLPFDVANRPESAKMCIARTTNALQLSGAGTDFSLIRLAALSENERNALEESHLISRDLLRSPDTAAVMVAADETLSIMMNEEDHLRIQSVQPGMNLRWLTLTTSWHSYCPTVICRKARLHSTTDS